MSKSITTTTPVHTTEVSLHTQMVGMNTSQKIRFLHSKGESRSEISKILNVSYQHVRNVLITPIKSQG